MKERITYFDFLRGLAILMVLGIHSYSVVPFDSITNVLKINMRELINFAVPLFLAISGYFIGQKKIESKKDYYAFLKKQISRVYVPMLLWSIPMTIFGIIEGKFWIKTVLQALICTTFGPYYFVLLIIQFYVFHPLILKAVNTRLGGAIIVFVNIVSFVLFNFVLKKCEVPFVFLVSPFFYWITFYAIGVYFSSHNRDYSLKLIGIIIIIGTVAQLASCFYTRTVMTDGYESVFAGWLYSISAWTYEMGAVLLLFSKKSEIFCTKYEKLWLPLRAIGLYAFGIYLCHVYTQYFVEECTSIEMWIIKWIIMTLLSVLTIYFLSLVTPKHVQKFLGLQ